MAIQDTSPHNLLIICSDELRAEYLGFMGNQNINTPNIDRLATQSFIFLEHFASFRNCVPARTPLAIRVPGMAGEFVDSLSGHTNFASTLLDEALSDAHGECLLPFKVA